MFFARLSIQWRITLLSGLSLLAVVGALTGASLYQNQQGATLLKRQSSQLLGQSALESLQAQALAHGQRVERFFSETAIYGEGFAQQVLQLRAQALNGRLTAAQLRHDLIDLTREALLKREKVLGFYVVLLPDALATEDASLAGQRDLASNEKGRFALYWSQSQPRSAPTPRHRAASRKTPGTSARKTRGIPA
jgi:methyl-accepting chemotaxis protein